MSFLRNKSNFVTQFLNIETNGVNGGCGAAAVAGARGARGGRRHYPLVIDSVGCPSRRWMM